MGRFADVFLGVAVKRWVLMAVVLVIPFRSHPAAQTKTPLTRLLEVELGKMPAKASVYVKHLGTGEEAAVAPDDPFNSYSVIKIAIMMMAFDLADQKKLDLTERHIMAPADYRWGAGVLRYHDAGLNPTLRDLIVEMIITSDNTATDLMLSKVGGVEKLNAWLKSKGFASTSMVSSIFEFYRRAYEYDDPKYRSLTPEELLRIQATKPRVETREARIKRESDQKNWLGVMTARETGRMLEAIENGTVLSKARSAEMKQIMLAQLAGARRIPHFLAPGYNVAHKTGDGPQVIANDVGMVYARSGTIVMAFFTTNNRGLWQDLEDQIGRAARLVVDYFDGRVDDPR
jgi:beta-lactamase class A